MSDPRFPIGKFHFDGPPDAQQREKLIGDIEQTPAMLRAAVQGLSAEQLGTPYRNRGWTVLQVVHHLPESHMNAYIRFKLALTEDEPVVKPYMEDRWAQLPDAQSTPAEVSLACSIHCMIALSVHCVPFARRVEAHIPPSRTWRHAA